VTRIVGSGSESGSGSIGQRQGSADPDPHQNVMKSQHCFILRSKKVGSDFLRSGPGSFPPPRELELRLIGWPVRSAGAGADGRPGGGGHGQPPAQRPHPRHTGEVGRREPPRQPPAHPRHPPLHDWWGSSTQRWGQGCAFRLLTHLQFLFVFHSFVWHYFLSVYEVYGRWFFVEINICDSGSVAESGCLSQIRIFPYLGYRIRQQRCWVGEKGAGEIIL